MKARVDPIVETENDFCPVFAAKSAENLFSFCYFAPKISSEYARRIHTAELFSRTFLRWTLRIIILNTSLILVLQIMAYFQNFPPVLIDQHQAMVSISPLFKARRAGRWVTKLRLLAAEAMLYQEAGRQRA